MVKNANFRGLRRIWEVLPTSCGIINLPPRQPRFLARLPCWQWEKVAFKSRLRLCFICLVWLNNDQCSVCVVTSFKFTDKIFSTILNITTARCYDCKTFVPVKYCTPSHSVIAQGLLRPHHSDKLLPLTGFKKTCEKYKLIDFCAVVPKINKTFSVWNFSFCNFNLNESKGDDDYQRYIMQRSKVFQFLEKSHYTCILKVYNAEINTSELLGKKVHAS